MNTMDDKQFFNQFPDRQARIRKPGRQLYTNKQRATQYADEFEVQYRSLGAHDPKRRVVLVWRLPRDHPAYEPDSPQLIPIPYILQAGENYDDTDEALLPLIEEIMMQQASGVGGFR